ncbi:hypothetical protein P153DRAFT_196566 [Dothidotthia symphoricarpi CBS 119687]|uniref:G-protein coupled receptors family 1 profile domain-containing protein n=1 Tax=Dothidotthia symphoricarpi CBS 119687 TaxID=1392245 RepID=A0A6A6AHR8_9PLEO|nr:uncharacterized protein P153DRAFT_196566 [Dothidotthia symphoricarpi CBS 119687]KAF2131489.1 hypothetical protein P153DRAFT_196566 [Dothidotthia symphoricarpi CBS 119687]
MTMMMTMTTSMQSWSRVLLVSGIARAAQASPLDKSRYLGARDDEKIQITAGEPASDRTLFTVLSLVCMMILSGLIGSRFSKLRECMRRRNIMTVLVIALYILVLLYTICAASLVAGQGLYSHQLCMVGTWVCLIYYISIKALIYTFLVERIHVVRKPFYRRREDPIYLSCMVMVVVMYSAVSINVFVHPITQMLGERCHFGINGAASIPTVAVNIFTDFVLTSVFIYLLRPVLADHDVPAQGIAHLPQNKTAVQKSLKALLWKSLIGSLLIEIPMAANMIQFMVTKGQELGMVCLTICLVDVFWDVLVIHWLTFSSADPDVDPSRQVEGSSNASLTRVRSLRSIDSVQFITGDCAPRECAVVHVEALETLHDKRKSSVVEDMSVATSGDRHGGGL